MEMLKSFFEGAFNQDEKFHDLEKIILLYKQKECHEYQQQLIDELAEIIDTQNYHAVSDIMKKYGNRNLSNISATEQFIHFLNNQLTDTPTNVNAEYFTSVEDEPITKFIDKSTANNAVIENLTHNAATITLWLTEGYPIFRVFEYNHNYPIGYGFLKTDDLSPFTLEESSIKYSLMQSKIVLEIDQSQDLGFRLVTAFPIEMEL